jgi:ABC-type nitrate/sulfonate/bicarbonate transport system ATPase subunit
MSDTLLKVDHVNLSYDGRPILRDLVAEIKRPVTGKTTGQVVGFIGPSGVGKSQFLRILAGLKKPDTGQVLVEDSLVFPGKVGIVAQNYPLFAHRSVLGNLMIAASNVYKDTKQALEAVTKYLDMYKLSDHKDNYPAQLSGGQRQRIAILQMVLSDSNVILMDEPFASLDMIMLELTCQTIIDMSNHGANKTVIVVTHDITSAASISDHIWLLGHERDSAGNTIPGARLVENYDVAARGLRYTPGIITRPDFLSFVAEVKTRFRSL